MKNLGTILLAIWLIAAGLIPLIGISFPASGTILALLAIAAGILLLLDRKKISLKGNIGALLLSIWLILSGLVPLLRLSFPASDVILAILAVAAGILLLLKR